MTEEWGPWIDHDGKGCPCVGQYVAIQVRGPVPSGSIPIGNIDCDIAETWAWWHDGQYDDIIRYRIRKPRAMKLLQSIVENPPKQRIKEDA